jgi:hypothetical protein
MTKWLKNGMGSDRIWKSWNLLVGGFNPSEKISQWERLSHILWKITNVPNHQPVFIN